MKINKTVIVLLLLFSLLELQAKVSNEELLLIKSIIPNSKIADVDKTPIDGLYIVMLENNKFLYVYPYKKLLFFGEMLTKDGRNLSAILKNTLMKNTDDAKDKDKLKEIISSKNAVRLLKEYSIGVEYNKGNKKYKVFMFTDPDCGWCRKLEKYFVTKNVDAGYLFTPSPRHPGAKEKSLQLISREDEISLLLKKIRNGEDINIKIKNSSEKRLENMMSLAKELKLQGTPMIIILDKESNKIVDFISGANLKKLGKYLKDSDEK